MGTPVHRLASHTKHLHNTLRMKAFVAAVATMAASADSQVLVNPYLGGQVIAGAPLGYAGVAGAPITTLAGAPGAIAAFPAAPLASQFHSQDEFGNNAYGYGNLHSAKHEAGNPLVGVSGGYTYVDANGELQTYSYVADGLGFRVKGTNLPVAPVYEGKAPVFDPELPVAPVDTAEVAAAREAHAAAVAEVNAREKRSTPASTEVLEIKPLEIKPVEVKALPLTYGGHGGLYAGAYGGYAPFGYGLHGYGAPLAYNAPLAAPLKGVLAAAPLAPLTAPLKAVVAAAPGAAEATLTKIKLNPGHAIAYSLA